MKNVDKKNNVLNFIAFVALMAFAVLEVFNVLSNAGILELGRVLYNLFTTVKNVCIVLVVAITAYNFIEGRSKGIKIAYWVAVLFVVVETILMWVL